MVTIMIISAMSGYSYHDVRKNNSLNDSSVIMDIDGEEVKDLYDEYECLLDGETFVNSSDTGLEELCEDMLNLGYGHNQALFDISTAAQDLDVKPGRSPYVDLLLYDRITLYTENIDYIAAHDRLRGVSESILAESNFSAQDTADERAMKLIEDGMINNRNICSITPPSVQFIEGLNGTVSQSDFTKNCESLFDDFMNPLNLTYQTALENGDWMATLVPDETSTEIENVFLPLAHSLAHASSSYWNCEDTTSPDRSELPIGENCEDSFSTIGRGADDPLFNTSSYTLNIILDAIALIICALVMVAALIATVVEFITMFDNDPNTNPDLSNVSKMFKLFQQFGAYFGAALKSFQRVAEETPDIVLDPEEEYYIGNATIVGPEDGLQSQYDQPSGMCPFNYSVTILGGDFEANSPFLEFAWTAEIVYFSNPSNYAYVVSFDESETDIFFWEQQQYRIQVVISSTIAENSVELETWVDVNGECANDGDDDDADGDVYMEWHQAMIITGGDCLDWKECALGDIARTMPSTAWIDKVCPEGEWHNRCYVAAVTGIKHNNFFGPSYISYEELGLRSRIGTSNIINNIDAAVVSTNDTRSIASYVNGGRDIISLLIDETLLQSELEENSGDSAALLQMKAIKKIAVDNNVHSDLVEFLNEIILGWNDSTIDDDYIKAINKRISDPDFTGLPDEIQSTYLAQKAVFHASEDVYSQLRIPPWVKKVLDAAEVIIGVVEIAHGNIIAGAGNVYHGGSSLLGRALGGGAGTHSGFIDETICAMDTFESCVKERLEANNYFVEERSTQSNSCGDDPALTSLTITTDQASYTVSERIDPMYMIDCSVPTLSYVLEAQMYRQSSGIVVHATDYTWTEANTAEEFREEIEGLDADTYCIDAVVFEKYATSATATASICFDVMNKDNSADPKDDDSVPGFSIMSGILALLGAVLVLNRRVKHELQE